MSFTICWDKAIYELRNKRCYAVYNKKRDEVVIKARGKFINRAVDIAEVSKKKFLKDQAVRIKDIKIDSEEFENKEGKKVNVSIIEITLSKK